MTRTRQREPEWNGGKGLFVTETRAHVARSTDPVGLERGAYRSRVTGWNGKEVVLMAATCMTQQTAIVRGIRPLVVVVVPNVCAHPGCGVILDGSALGIECSDCRRQLCRDHRIDLDGAIVCLGCAIVRVEAQEPECECHFMGDKADGSKCEYHNPYSRWNGNRRVVLEAL